MPLIQTYRRMNPFGIANALTNTIEAMEQLDQPSTPPELRCALSMKCSLASNLMGERFAMDIPNDLNNLLAQLKQVTSEREWGD